MKLSIITINYNNLSGLQRTVESVLKQTVKEFEYIIIDGGSTDGSAAYIESQSEHIDYWVSEPDKGIYNAMNKGILKAKGEYLLFLNSGDHFYNNNVIDSSIPFLNTFDLVYGSMEIIEFNNSYIQELPDKLTFYNFIKGTLPHAATFIKRISLIKYGGYSEDFKVISDWRYFLDGIMNHNLSYRKINIVVSCFYLGGISGQAEHQIEKKKVLNDLAGFFYDDYVEMYNLKSNLKMIRQKKIIKILIKLGILKEFYYNK